MGLFDILLNPEVRSVLGSLAGKATETLRETNVTGTLKNGWQELNQKMPQGMGGVIGAGALGALIGSMLPKSAAGAAGMLGLGAVAWNFYKKWSAENKGPQALMAGESANLASDPAAALVLRAMVFAARADGHIDADEERRIEQLVPQFFPGVNAQPIVQELMQERLDPASLAAQVTSQEQAEDLYRLSCVIVDIDHFMEESYFAALEKQLKLSPARAQELKAEAKAVKEQLAQYA